MGVLLALVSSPADSTTLMNMETSEVARSASWIGRVRVLEVSQPDSAQPLLNVTAEVLDVLKGSSSVGERVSFRIPGGRVSGRSISVMGFAEFKKQREYLVFLDSVPTPRTGLSLEGSAVGLQNWTAYEVSRNKQGNRLALRAGAAGLAHSSSRGLSITHDTQERRLEDLYSDIFRGLN